MQKCPNCGNKLSNIDVLCPKCGALVEVVRINPNRPVYSSNKVINNPQEKKPFDEHSGGQDTHVDSDNTQSQRIEKPFGFDDFSHSHPDVPKDDFNDKANDISKDSKPLAGNYDEPFPMQSDNDFSRSEKPGDAPENNLSDMVLVPDPIEDAARSKRHEGFTANQSLPGFDHDDLDDFDPEEFMRQYRENKKKGLYNSEEPERSSDEKPKHAADNPPQYRRNGSDGDHRHMQQQAADEIKLPKRVADNPRQYRHSRNNDDLHRMKQKATDDINLPKRSVGKLWLEIEEVSDTPEASREARRYSPIVISNSQDDLAGSEEKSFESPLASTESQRHSERIENTQTRNESGDVQTRSRIKLKKKHEKASAPKPEKNFDRKISPLFTLLIWVVVAVALFFGFIYLDNNIRSAYGTYGNFINEVTNGKLIADPDAQANLHNIYISKTQSKLTNGDYAHRYKVASKDGVRINVVGLDQPYDLQNGRADLLISDYELAKALNLHSDGESITTDKASFIVETNAASYTYTIDEVELFLNDATYSRLKPASSNHIAPENFFYLEIRVDPSALVTVNGVDYSGDIDDAGLLSAQIPVDKVGESTYDLRITQIGKATVTDTILITREKKYAKLLPNDEYFRVYSDTFTAKGETEVGSRVTATINEDIYHGNVDPGGLYSVVCTVSTYGLHYINIAVSNDAYIDTAKTIKVELLPEPSAFTAQAKSLSIGEIIQSSHTLQNIPIRVSGVTKNLLSSEDEKNFKLTDDDREMSCFYYGETPLEENMVVTLYGMFDIGKNSFYVMFVP